MNQLINAAEIAVSEGWEEVVEVLAETGRVLQSYENEGQAHLCVPFLTESYEILSQMVSDLILGKVRSGLMQKWRNRYRMALEDLKDAGIRLVRDEDDDRRNSRTPAKNAASARWTPNREPEVEAPRVFPFEMPPADGVPASPAPAGFETPRIEDYLGEPEPEEESPTDEAALDAETEPDDAWAGSPGAAEWMSEAGAEDEVEEELVDLPRLGNELPPLAPLAPLGGHLMPLEDEPEAPAEEPPQAAGFAGTPPPVIEQLDVLCERLSHMEREAEPDLKGCFDTIGYAVLFLEEQAELCERPACGELCRAMSRLCDRADRRGTLPEDKFFELAYAFCGVYVEADDAADDETIGSWIAESESLIASWARVEVEEVSVAAASDEAVEPEVEETFEPVEAETEAIFESAEPETPAVEFMAEPEPEVEEEFVAQTEPETVEAVEPAVEVVEAEEAIEELEVEETIDEPEAPEAPVEEEAAAEAPAAPTNGVSADQLLLVAQRAMTDGNAGEAKRLALQAAAMLAQIEVDEAARRVADAERRLQEGASLTDQARADVQRAEQVVADVARSVTDGQKALETRRAEITGISQKLAEVEGLVEGLDEQIRQLQAKRDEEAHRMAETRAELDNAHSREALTQAELASRAEAEQEARVRLEDARQRVKNLQRKRTEVESTMERARELLTQRRVSLADIEQMLSHVNGKPAVEDETDAGEFLF